MTIEYKDSKRIVALSSDLIQTPTYSDDFSGTDDWADQGSGIGVNTTTDRLEFSSWTDNSTNNSSTLDLGSALSDTKWTIRFKLQWTGFSNTTDWTAPAIGMFSASSATAGNSAQDMLFYWSIANGATKRAYLSSADNSTISGTDHNLNLSWVLDTTYYIQLQRDGSNFSATVWTGSYNGTEVASGTDTIGGTVSGLQYFGVKSPVTSRGGSFTGWLDDLQIWNGILATSLPYKPTDVQDNSIIVEKDTARRYWFSADNSGFPTNSSHFEGHGQGTVTDTIDIPTTGLSNLATGSVSFWIYLETESTSAGDYVVLSGSNTGVGSSEFALGFVGHVTGVGIICRNNGSGVCTFTCPSSLTRNAWNHVVYTNNSSGNKVYVNGSQVTPSYSVGSASTNAFFNSVASINTCTIGANKDNGGYQWGYDGNLQELLVYNTVLTQAEINTLYNNGNYNSSPSSTGLLRRYELTSNANDTSGNGHNGTSTAGVNYTSVPSPTPATWTMQPTYQDDFSTDKGWVTVGSNGTISITGGELFVDTVTGNSDTRIYKALGFTLETDWIARWEQTMKGTTDNNVYMQVMNFTAGNANLNAGTNQDSVHMITDSGNQTIFIRSKDGTTAGNQQGSQALTTDTKYYMEFVKDGTGLTLKIRTGSHSGTLVNTLTTTCSSGITGLTHIQTGGATGTNSGAASYSFDNIEIYNGVTSIT